MDTAPKTGIDVDKNYCKKNSAKKLQKLEET